MSTESVRVTLKLTVPELLLLASATLYTAKRINQALTEDIKMHMALYQRLCDDLQTAMDASEQAHYEASATNLALVKRVTDLLRKGSQNGS